MRNAPPNLRRWVVIAARHGRSVQWLEKVWLVLDRMQVLGIVWLCSNRWPWPEIWLHWTHYLVLVNADFPAIGTSRRR